MLAIYRCFSGGLDILQRICLQCRTPGFEPWVRKMPWRREWQPTPVFLPRESHKQMSLSGYSPWGHKESDMTKQQTLSLILSEIIVKSIQLCQQSRTEKKNTGQMTTKVLEKEERGWALGRGPRLRLCVPYTYSSQDFPKEKGVYNCMDILPNHHPVSFIQTAVFGQSAHTKISQGGVGKGYAHDIVPQHTSLAFRGVKHSKGK